MRYLSPVRYAGYLPASGPPRVLLLAAAAFSVGIWWSVEVWTGGLTHPAYTQMLRAAHKMESAIQVARSQRTRLGLMQPPEVDPNRTGLIGAEYTETTTSLGDLDAKRTATNPDLAAAIARRIADLRIPAGSRVLLVMSGSFIGANIAAILAVEALDLRPVIVSSLGASMHGATDEALTWLDIETELRNEGVISSKSAVALLGGNSAVGSGMSETGVAALRVAALRNDVPLIEGEALKQVLDQVDSLVRDAAGGDPELVINSGGSVIALGTCTNGHLIPTLASSGELDCQDGRPGLLVMASRRGKPTMNLLFLRGLAADWELPFNPIPLPAVGNNRAVYGAPHPE